MEHGFPMNRQLLFSLIAWLLLCGGATRSVAQQNNLVLVANTQSPIAELTAAQARKLYLGVPLQINGRTINPLRNISDPLLREVFMQRVMYMATETYERQILNRVFRNGGQRPATHSDLRKLVEALKRDTLAISYMWNEVALTTPGIKIIGQ